MKKIFWALCAVFCLGWVNNAQAATVTLKVIDKTKGQITNKVDDQNEVNIFCWIDDELSSQNPRTPSDWWYPMYSQSGVTPTGQLIKGADDWTWQITLNASEGTYKWNPHAKTLGWNPIGGGEGKTAMYAYNGDDGNNLIFTVSATGEISGHTELLIDPNQKFPVTLKVIDYSKGLKTDAPGTWAQNANITVWIGGDLNPGPYWFYGLFDTTVSNWDGTPGNAVSFPNGKLIKDDEKWTWQATFQASPGSYEWDPRNILLGWASLSGINLVFNVSNTGEVTGDYYFEIDKPEPEGLTKVACIGDSNTAGAGVSNPTAKAWPAQMRDILDKDLYSVKNLGISGATLMNFPEPWGAWENNTQYIQALKDYNPKVVLVALGTNDSKGDYWGKRDFKAEYISFINRYKTGIEANPEIYMVIPIKALNNGFGISNDNIVNGVIPIINQISKENMIPVIDWYSITSSATNADLPDGVHANDATSNKMAAKAAQILLTEKPVVSINTPGSTLRTAYAEYRWYRNGVLISNSNSETISVSQAGAYNVAVKLNANTDDIIVSAPFDLGTATATELTIKTPEASSVFNPVKEADFYYASNLNAVVINNAQGAGFSVYNTAGMLLKSVVVSEQNAVITLSDLPKGIYVCKIVKESKNVVKKILK